MSRYQVDPNERIPIYEFTPGSQGDAVPNVIYIRARMNVEQENRVLAIATMRSGGGEAMIDDRAAEYVTAQMVVNILAWAGPDFDGLPCTPETIRNLPGNDEFVDRVRNEIAQRNPARRSPDQKKVIANGSSSAGSKPSTALRSADIMSANGISRSRSPSASAGRRSK